MSAFMLRAVVPQGLGRGLDGAVIFFLLQIMSDRFNQRNLNSEDGELPTARRGRGRRRIRDARGDISWGYGGFCCGTARASA